MSVYDSKADPVKGERWFTCWDPSEDQPVPCVRCSSWNSTGADGDAISDERKFDVDMAQAVKISPQHIHESEAHDAAFREPIFPQGPMPAVGENARSFKRLYVKQADLDAFGYTPDCVRCKHAMKYGPERTNMPHSDQCRTRIA